MCVFHPAIDNVNLEIHAIDVLYTSYNYYEYPRYRLLIHDMQGGHCTKHADPNLEHQHGVQYIAPPRYNRLGSHGPTWDRSISQL